jgi:hypothetical protein
MVCSERMENRTPYAVDGMVGGRSSAIKAMLALRAEPAPIRLVYLRFTQGISFEWLAKPMSDILGLDISESALVTNATLKVYAARFEARLEKCLRRVKARSSLMQ